MKSLIAPAFRLAAGLSRAKRLAVIAAAITIFFLVSPVTTSAHINSLIPSSTIAGNPTFTLRILGTDFDESDTTRVLFDGTRVSTTLISSQELQSTIPSTLIRRPGVVRVTLEGFNSVDFTIYPASDCQYLISIGQGANKLIGQIFPSDGGTGTINISTIADCAWGVVVTQAESIVSLTSVSSESGGQLLSPLTATGIGNGTLWYSVPRNTTGARRSAIIRLHRRDFSGLLDAEPFTVTQEGPRCPASAYSISPLNTVREDEAGSDSIHLTAPIDCAWTATSEQRWIDVRTYTGLGSATISYDVRANEGPPRSGVINIAGKEFFVFQIPSDCFIRNLCAYFPSACRELGEGLLTSSRRFRDDVLAKTPRGQRYTKLYYQFSSEAVGIVMLNPTLILRSREVLQRYRPVLESMAKGEQVTLTRGDLEEIEGFLNAFSQKCSPELKGTLRGLCEDLRDPRVHSEFNITVIEGSKRELPADSAAEIIKETGKMITSMMGLLFFSIYPLRCRRKKNAGKRLSQLTFRSAAFRRTVESLRLKSATTKLLPRSLKRPLAVIVILLVSSGQGSVVGGQSRSSGRGPVVGGQSRSSGQWSVVSGQSYGSRQGSVVGGQWKKRPLSFKPNQGQVDSQVKFISRGTDYDLFLAQNEAAFRFRNADSELRIKIVGANNEPKITGIDQLPEVSNYFIGNDSAKWRVKVPTYAKVKYESIYRGVDMIYYGNQDGLEYDLVVASGANPGQIRLAIQGSDEMKIDSQGDLVLHLPDGEFRQRRPFIYQEVNGTRLQIQGRYTLIEDAKSEIHDPKSRVNDPESTIQGQESKIQNLKSEISYPKSESQDPESTIHNPKSEIQNHLVGFEIGQYDQTRPLIIDPVLAYTTYFGGNGNEEGSSITVDRTGNVYLTGFTDSINFPSINASQPNLGGGPQDAFVVKLDASGTRVLYSTYLGGNGQDNGTSIAVDSAGNAYITGFTDSTNFPVRNAVQPSKRGNFNAFVVKLDSNGTIVNSTLLGGSLSDYGSSIAVDPAGNIYVAGIATSNDVPMTNPLQSAPGGLVDVYVAKMDPSGARLVYATYLGGIGIEGASSIAVDSAGNLYLTGLTSSPNFRTVNALQSAHGGGLFDAFVTKLNPSGSEVIYSTYLGGSGEDRAFRIAIDSTGSAYVTGDTDSTNFPVANSVQQSKGGSADAFITKLNPSGNQLVYSTYLGGTGLDGGTALAVDASGSAYVTGFTASINFPIANPLQQVFGGHYDGFVAKLSSSGSALDYSTYFGGSGIDSGFGIAVDAAGNASVMGVTDSLNLTTVTPLQSTFGGGTADVFVAKIKSGPIVTRPEIQGKHLLVFGSGFDNGAVILINGEEQRTRNDESNPTGALFGKKSGKKIAPGQTVTVRVRNSDGALSNEFRFARP